MTVILYCSSKCWYIITDNFYLHGLLLNIYELILDAWEREEEGEGVGGRHQ